MWVYCLAGFFSICQKPWDKVTGTLTIRARDWNDLEALRRVLPELGETEIDHRADYLVRAQAPRLAVARVFGELAASIDYANFKAAVQPLMPDRSMIYHRVHAETMGLDLSCGEALWPPEPKPLTKPPKKKKRPRKKLPVYNR